MSLSEIQKKPPFVFPELGIRISKKEPLFKAIPPISPEKSVSLKDYTVKILSPRLYFQLMKRGFFKICLAIVNKKTGGIERLILPALASYSKANMAPLIPFKQAFTRDPKNRAESISFETEDNIKIDGLTIRNGSSNKWIIFMNPNAMCYETNLNFLHEYGRTTGVNILAFNYRGVGESEGYPAGIEDLVKDGDAAFQYLMNQEKANSNEILLHGLSLGGIVATYVRTRHPDGPVVNQNSLSTIGNFIEGALLEILEEHPRRACLSNLIARFASNILKEAAWEVDCMTKWREIKGYKWIISATEDELMHGKGKFYQALKVHTEGYIGGLDKRDPNNEPQLRKNRQIKKSLNHVKSIGTSHCETLSKKAQATHFAHIRAALQL